MATMGRDSVRRHPRPSGIPHGSPPLRLAQLSRAPRVFRRPRSAHVQSNALFVYPLAARVVREQPPRPGACARRRRRARGLGHSAPCGDSLGRPAGNADRRGLLRPAVIWFLIGMGWLTLGQRSEITWIALICLAGLRALGLSWSHVRRRLTGQVDADDVDV